jgi:hypothetical protein
MHKIGARTSSSAAFGSARERLATFYVVNRSRLF